MTEAYAVIDAGAVVVKDGPPNCNVAGNCKAYVVRKTECL